MKSVFTRVALPLLLLFILDGLLPPPLLPALSVKAFPATAISTTTPSSVTRTVAYNNSNQTTTEYGVTEYPVFISVTEEALQPSPETAEPEVVTETYMIVEDQEVDDDDDDDSSTMSPAIVRSTTPMQSPKSSPEQEEVLRELKKLWDLSEGMTDNGNDALKNSLSSIVHLAYARVYVEPDETLLKLKYLLQQLQERILLGSNLNGEENPSTTTSNSSSSSMLHDAVATESSSYSTTMNSLLNNVPMTATTVSPTTTTTEQAKRRRKRGIYEDDEVEAIFFANVNSEENSVIPEEETLKDQQDQHQLNQSPNHETTQQHDKSKQDFKSKYTIEINSTKDPIITDRTHLSFSTISSTTTSTSVVSAVSTTTPSTVVQKVIHIHDRQKPMPSFFLTPERIKELKSRVTSTTSTLSPISIAINDELENEVNLLQQQQNVDNYDIHISSSSETLAPLTTTTPSLSGGGGGSTIIISPLVSSTTEFPYSAEDIALALFQLLRPDTFDEDESEENVTTQPHPSPSNILYQVGSLSSVLNFTINKAQNISTSTSTTETTVPSKINTTMSEMPLTSSTTTMAPATQNATLSLLKLKEKYMTKEKNNSTLVVPPALLDLANGGLLSTSTERQSQNISQNNDVYDYTDVLDQTQAAATGQTSITTNIMQGTQEGVQQMVGAVTRLSVGAKMVLLFSVSISILSIGFGIFSLGPPLTGVGVLGIIIPVVLLLLFETTASGGKRKMTMRQKEQLLISKLQSEEFSKILDMIFDAAIKYSKG